MVTVDELAYVLNIMYICNQPNQSRMLLALRRHNHRIVVFNCNSRGTTVSTRTYMSEQLLHDFDVCESVFKYISEVGTNIDAGPRTCFAFTSSLAYVRPCGYITERQRMSAYQRRRPGHIHMRVHRQAGKYACRVNK